MAASSAPTIAARYVTALLGHVSAPATRDTLSRELNNWAENLAPGQALAEFAANPTLPRTAQEGVVDALATKHGASAELKQLLGLLSRERRLNLLPEIAAQFYTHVLAERGRSQADVTSAVALSDAQKKPIQDALGAQTEISWHADASLLGGLVVERAGTTLDLSVSGQLAQVARGLGAKNAA